MKSTRHLVEAAPGPRPLWGTRMRYPVSAARPSGCSTNSERRQNIGTCPPFPSPSFTSGWVRKSRPSCGSKRHMSSAPILLPTLKWTPPGTRCGLTRVSPTWCVASGSHRKDRSAKTTPCVGDGVDGHGDGIGTSCDVRSSVGRSVDHGDVGAVQVGDVDLVGDRIDG